MGNIYPAGSDKNLLLYSSNNSIYLRTAIGDSLGRPVLLANDYQSNLCTIIFNGTIFYSYENTNKDILIRSITDTGTLFRISSVESPDIFNPQLLNFHNSLLLLYIIRNPLDESFSIKFCYPFEPERHLAYPHSYKEIPVIQCTTIQDLLFLHIYADNTITPLQIHNDDTFIFLIDRNAILEKQKFQYEQELRKRETLIESIKKQYNELMDTATKYREEAIKWRDKYYSD